MLLWFARRILEEKILLLVPRWLPPTVALCLGFSSSACIVAREFIVRRVLSRKRTRYTHTFFLVRVRRIRVLVLRSPSSRHRHARWSSSSSGVSLSFDSPEENFARFRCQHFSISHVVLTRILYTRPLKKNAQKSLSLSLSEWTKVVKALKASSWDHARRERERERESSAHAEKKSRKNLCRLSVVEMIFFFYCDARTFFLTFVFPFTFQLFLFRV